VLQKDAQSHLNRKKKKITRYYAELGVQQTVLKIFWSHCSEIQPVLGAAHSAGEGRRKENA